MVSFGSDSRLLALDLVSGVESKVLRSLLVVVGGVIGLSLLAQIVIPLPWTPVPVSGQTFGVGLIALACGRKHGLAVFGSYLALAFFGFPVLAQGLSGLALGPTFGYLVGMGLAIVIVGGLAETGFAKGFWRSLLSLYVGSLVIFGFGLIGLSFFVPSDGLLTAGLYPFLLGDLIKNTAAASIYSSFKKSR